MRNQLFLTLLLLIFLSGCTKDAPPVTQQIDMGSFEGSCKIDTERLKKMLDEYVYGEIDCIASNLQQFADFVQRPDPTYIDRPDLDKFINKFFSSTRDQMVRSLHLLFDVNTLFMADRPNSIAVSKIKSLFELVKILNKYAVPLNKIFKGLKDNKNYWSVRGEIESQFMLLTRDLRRVIFPHTKNPRQVDLMSMIRRFKDGLELGDDVLKPEVIEDYLFVKKLFLGGDSGKIDTAELYILLEKLPTLAISTFDVLYFADNPNQSSANKITFYLDTLMSVRKSLHPLHDSEEVFTHQDLMNFGEEVFAGTEFEFKKVEPSIINLKNKLIGGSADKYLFGELIKVMNRGQTILEQLVFNHVTYEHFKQIMENGKPIETISMPELQSYKRFLRPRVFELWEEFRFIVTDYRQFHSPEGLIYFTNDHYRSIDGVNLKALIRFGLNVALEVYGHAERDPRSGKVLFMAATKDELKNLLLDVEHIMKELELWPKYFDRFLSEASTSSDLFQYHSNGDGVISHIEASDYVSNIIAAANMAAKLHVALNAHCPYVPDEDGLDAFEVPCYRKHLFKTVFEDLNYRKYFQKLYDYTVHFPAREIEKFIADVESFSKEERDTKIPMSKVDLGRLFVALGNIETTMIRYDLNKSNILERNEIDGPFPVFKKTLIEFGKLKPSQEALAESIYLYILKKMKEPSAAQLIFFHVFGGKKKITARRMNIGAILALVAEATIPKTKDEQP